jgi:hypothetical protein
MAATDEKSPSIESLGEVVERELNYQLGSKLLQAEADRLLEKWSPSEVVHQRLAQISEDLARLSADRPQEFGGRFSAGDVEAMQII